MPSLIWFEWEKCPDGYTVEDLRPEYVRSQGMFSSRYIATKEAPEWVRENIEDRIFSKEITDFEQRDQFLIPNSQRVLKFNPIDETGTGLFLEIADCFNSVPKITEFVTKYGALYKGGVPDGGEKLDLSALHIGTIQEFSIKMKQAVEVWEEAKSLNSFGNLARFFNLETLANDKHRERSPHMNSSTLSPRLHTGGISTSPPIFSLVPEGLHSALWLQFAQAVSANLQLQRCIICPTWFAFGTGTGRRKSAHYCSDKCRKAAHRRQTAKKRNG